jgi:histone H3/H4
VITALSQMATAPDRSVYGGREQLWLPAATLPSPPQGSDPTTPVLHPLHHEAELPADLFQPAPGGQSNDLSLLGDDTEALIADFFLNGDDSGLDDSSPHLCKELRDVLMPGADPPHQHVPSDPRVHGGMMSSHAAFFEQHMTHPGYARHQPVHSYHHVAPYRQAAHMARQQQRPIHPRMTGMHPAAHARLQRQQQHVPRGYYEAHSYESLPGAHSTESLPGAYSHESLPGAYSTESLPGAFSTESLPGAQPACVYDQERFLPLANIVRLMARNLPAYAKISQDCKRLMQEAVTEFICFITSEANDLCVAKGARVVGAKDIHEALGKLGAASPAGPRPHPPRTLHITVRGVGAQRSRSCCRRSPR